MVEHEVTSKTQANFQMRPITQHPSLRVTVTAVENMTSSQCLVRQRAVCQTRLGGIFMVLDAQDKMGFMFSEHLVRLRFRSDCSQTVKF